MDGTTANINAMKLFACKFGNSPENKLLKSNNYYHRQTMKVKIAAQTFFGVFLGVFLCIFVQGQWQPTQSQLIQIYSVYWTDAYDTHNIEHRTEPGSH